MAADLPAELLEVRKQIDHIDSELVRLLSERFALTHRVGILKASNSLDAVDAARESEKLEELRQLCREYNLNPDLVSELFSAIMAEVVRNHEALRQSGGDGPGNG